MHAVSYAVDYYTLTTNWEHLFSETLRSPNLTWNGTPLGTVYANNTLNLVGTMGIHILIWTQLT